MKIALIALFFICLDVSIASKSDDALNYVRSYYKKLDQIQNSPICEECRTVFDDLKGIVSNSAKFAKMQSMLKNTCSLLSGDTAVQCQSIVSALGMYANKLKSMLANPDDICHQMKLCRGGKDAAPGNKAIVLALKAVTQSINKASTSLESENCDECVLVVNTMYAILDDKGVEKVLKSVVTRVCSAIKDDNFCESLVDEYFDAYMASVVKYLSNPIGACTKIFVCRTSANPDQPLTLKNFEADARYQRLSSRLQTLSGLQTKSGVSAGCITCKSVLTAAIATLNQPSILKKTADSLGTEVCNIFPSSLYPGCKDWMNYYLEAILFMTINNWTPDQICTKIKACSSTSQALEFRSLALNQPDSFGCEACKDVASYLNDQLTDPEFQNDVLSLVKYFSCSSESNPDSRLKCETGVDVVGPYILVDSCPIWLSKLCSFLHLCPKN